MLHILYIKSTHKNISLKTTETASMIQWALTGRVG